MVVVLAPQLQSNARVTLKPFHQPAAILATALAACGCIDQYCYANRDCELPQLCDRRSESPSFGRCRLECATNGDCEGAGFEYVDNRCMPTGAEPIVCPKDMVPVNTAFCIDVHEASRPDATATSAGGTHGPARSRSEVIPWMVADNATAAAACAASGKRLCTPVEWETACRGPKRTVYGYGDSYQPTKCNGIDTFGRNDFHLLPTGSLSDCTNGYGVFDMNGNLWEHVAGGSDVTVRGGAYNCSDSQLLHRCDYVPGNWTPSARGFRCCKDPR